MAVTMAQQKSITSEMIQRMKCGMLMTKMMNFMKMTNHSHLLKNLFSEYFFHSRTVKFLWDSLESHCSFYAGTYFICIT